MKANETFQPNENIRSMKISVINVYHKDKTHTIFTEMYTPDNDALRKNIQMSTTESFGRKLLLIIIPLFLGSFVFIGVIENYKNDSMLKIKILEDYFKPSRQQVADCLKKQNSLFLKYPEPPAHLKLFTKEMFHLIENPSLNGNADYEVVLEALISTYQKSAKELEQLEIETEQCKTDVFRSLETLAIVTGSFDEFSRYSEQRAQQLNAASKIKSDQNKKNRGSLEVDDLQNLMRSIATANFESREGQEEFKLKMTQMLPVIESHGEIMSSFEKRVFDIENDFYSNVRTETSTKISELFEEGFFGWIL